MHAARWSMHADSHSAELLNGSKATRWQLPLRLLSLEALQSPIIIAPWARPLDWFSSPKFCETRQHQGLTVTKQRLSFPVGCSGLRRRVKPRVGRLFTPSAAWA